LRTNEPLRTTVVGLADLVTFADRSLDVQTVEVTLLTPRLGVGGPNEVLDGHASGAYVGSRASTRPVMPNIRPQG
jgi:hypothetical protein